LHKFRTARIKKNAGAFRDRVIPGEIERLFSPQIDLLKTAIRSRHYSIRTETAYLDWVRRFIAFQGHAHPGGIDATRTVKEYLDYLAVEREVAPIGEIETFVRAKRPQRLPEVMTRDEVRALLDQMEAICALMAGLMYGGGLRLKECVRLRVKDIDFRRHQIMVGDGEGQKVRRHHIHENLVQKAVKEAALRAGIDKKVSCHTLRSFATHLLEARYDIRTVRNYWGMQMSQLE